MSRTDKDRPYRVKVMDPTLSRNEEHDHLPETRFCVTGFKTVVTSYPGWDASREVRVGYRHAYDAVCDIDDFNGERRDWRSHHCGYSLPWHEARYRSSPPAWYRRAVYHAPERTNARDVLRAATKDWNANGDTDIEPVSRQTRNSAAWLWW